MCVGPSCRHAENLASKTTSHSVHSSEQSEDESKEARCHSIQRNSVRVCNTGGVLKNPYQTVLPAAAFPYPSIDQLRPMTVFDVHCGRYRDITFWDWVKTNMPNVLSIIPH